MPNQPSCFQLAPNLTASLSWSVRTVAFVHKWRKQESKLLTGTEEAHLAEATTTVLSAVEYLDEQVAQTLLDLYQVTNQLPSPGDTLLVGPLELSVEHRQLEVTRPGGVEQVAVTYLLEIERYRYETISPASLAVGHPTLTAQRA